MACLNVGTCLSHKIIRLPLAPYPLFLDTDCPRFKVFKHYIYSNSGLSVRSVCWAGEKILVGTNSSEIYEVLASNKESPRTLVQVHFIY